MNLTRLSLSNPVAVVAAILMVLLLGTVGLSRLPIQMIPDVERPFIQINTGWRAAAPEEVESDIIEPQEDVLRGVPGLEKMVASASRGNASISLTFRPDMDLQRALIEVMNRLNQVPRYPNDVTEPRIYAGQDQFGAAIAWFSLKPVPGNTRPMASYSDFVEEVVQARIERVPGVANSNAYGGRPNEVRITFDPYEAAALGVDIPTVSGLTGNNNDTSGGFTDVGRRQYTLRFNGKYNLDEFGDMVLDWRGGNPIKLRDIASVEVSMRDPAGFLLKDGFDSIAFDAQVEKGVNVLNVMEDLKEAIEELKNGAVARAGLEIDQDYDETIYIKSSIAMLRTNLLIGIALAIAVLWWFLRRFRATLMVAVTIPICLFMAFLVMQISGRTLNMISLAGLAFAMGMVLDAAIVVLENIVRLREKKVPSEEAANRGVSQVWGALLASTATTVAIFLPIIFQKDVSGQLFADLAIAITIAIITSLFVAVSVIPTAAANWLRNVSLEDNHEHWWRIGTKRIMSLTDGVNSRRVIIVTTFAIATSLSWYLLPSASYLPEGKQSWIFTFVQPPPGQSVTAAKTEFADEVTRRLAGYLQDDGDPHLSSYFGGVFGNFGFYGFDVTDPARVDEFLDILNGQVFAGFPDTMAFSNRMGVFERLSGGGDIEINIQSRDMDSVLSAANSGLGAVSQLGLQARPIPGVDFAEPELRLIPDERRITEAGWNRQEMSIIARALGDGVFVGDYFDGDRTLDIVLRATPWQSPEQLAATPLATPNGGIQLVGELMRMERTAGPAQIRRVDRRRAVTLSVRPPEDQALDDVIGQLKQTVEPQLLQQLPEDGEISYYGSAANLDIALENMAQSFIFAVAILFLLVSA
ncbi:MAG: efflux RND transporter permease subunit, partial [Pseudomonadota bacterium]